MEFSSKRLGKLLHQKSCPKIQILPTWFFQESKSETKPSLKQQQLKVYNVETYDQFVRVYVFV